MQTTRHVWSNKTLQKFMHMYIILTFFTVESIFFQNLVRTTATVVPSSNLIMAGSLTSSIVVFTLIEIWKRMMSGVVNHSLPLSHSQDSIYNVVLPLPFHTKFRSECSLLQSRFQAFLEGSKRFWELSTHTLTNTCPFIVTQNIAPLTVALGHPSMHNA